MGKKKEKGPGKQEPPRRAPRLRWGLGIAVGLVIVVVVGVVAYFAFRAVADLPGTSFASQGNAHIQLASDPHPPYNSDPPTSGPHLPYLAPWGIHTRPIPKELQVHNLEDGGVIIQYNCECPELVEKLAAVVKPYVDHVILAPYPGMKSKIALTAWTRLDTLDEFDEARVVRFIRAYRGTDHHQR